MRDHRPGRRRPVGAEDLPPAEGHQAGTLHARAQTAAGGADEDDGQRGHVLHAAHAIHLHLQVRSPAHLASRLVSRSSLNSEVF